MASELVFKKARRRRRRLEDCFPFRAEVIASSDQVREGHCLCGAGIAMISCRMD